MSMQVTYTLKEYNVRETSKGRGILSYHLVDNEGHNRTVSAIVKFGFRNKITSIHPLHHRESPLFKVLQKTSVNETVQVDFTEYNTKYPRADISNQTLKAKNTSIAYAEQEHLINDLETLGKNKFRVLQLLGLAAIVLTAIMSVKHSFF